MIAGRPAWLPFNRLSAAQHDSNLWRICHIRSRSRLAQQLDEFSDTTSPMDHTTIM
jgi:hypothetical protein